MGGSADERWLSASDDEIKRTVQEELREIPGVQKELLEFVINRWPRAILKYKYH
jgi:protoporphyrinogen oxidase